MALHEQFKASPQQSGIQRANYAQCKRSRSGTRFSHSGEMPWHALCCSERERGTGISRREGAAQNRLRFFQESEYLDPVRAKLVHFLGAQYTLRRSEPKLSILDP
jgi:hypothetical protein